MIYSTLLRITLYIVFVAATIIGLSFYYQHWQGGKNILVVALVALLIIIVDVLISKKSNTGRK